MPILDSLAPNNWSLHTAISVTAAVSAMSCVLPGVWLLLRRQSMMGDALSHSALPGIVIAFIVATLFRSAGWISDEGFEAWEHLLLFVGAVAAGISTAWLTEWIHNVGHVEANAALGVVFTGLFALGLFLVRFVIDDVHLDTECVLFGRLVETALETTPVFGQHIPTAALLNGGLLLVNGLLTALLYKELKIAAFDPEHGTAMGIDARLLHYGLMAATAITVVAAFETVGSILVIGLLIIPAATAQFLTDRLQTLIALALLLAAGAAASGHWLSQTVPAPLFARLGFPEVQDASTPGMIAVAAGLLFVLAWLASPRHGLLLRGWRRLQLLQRIVGEDLLAGLYRVHERNAEPSYAPSGAPPARVPQSGWLARWQLWSFARRGLVRQTSAGYVLTPQGIQAAAEVVRGHRLWESYLDRHFNLPGDHLHASAHRAEHFLDEPLRSELSTELNRPTADPHGSRIPGESGTDSPGRSEREQPS